MNVIEPGPNTQFVPQGRKRRSRFQLLVYSALTIFACLWILFLVTDTKVLIWETKVNPGQEYVVPDFGNLGASKQASLVGRYFNGRRIVTRVFWYSPNNLFGRESCPFILRDSTS